MSEARRHVDSGEALLETILSVLFISLGVVMIVSAVGTGTTLTAGHKTLTDTDVALKRAAEVVKAATYVARAATYDVSSVTGSNGVTVSVTSVQCVTISATAIITDLGSATSCATIDTGLQVVTVRATASGTSESTVVVKRKTS